MIPPHRLVGMPYRLGADPERHGKVDCLSLTRTVLAWQGIKTPAPTRDWYRRLYRGDYSIFKQQLEQWGKIVASPRLTGTVALCESDNGYAMAVYWEGGFLHCLTSEVKWSPANHLVVVAFYCPQK
jgi:cell wall-associated NlpC family hydrolase